MDNATISPSSEFPNQPQRLDCRYASLKRKGPDIPVSLLTAFSALIIQQSWILLALISQTIPSSQIPVLVSCIPFLCISTSAHAFNTLQSSNCVSSPLLPLFPLRWVFLPFLKNPLTKTAMTVLISTRPQTNTTEVKRPAA